ncbi:MAG: diacylglycerol kinase family lipid kinase [Acidobacteria bacterium]|nr:diacylglycerol kinase family lipid kinase [Acidobacteriota bacterium]
MSDRTLVLINPTSGRARSAWIRIKDALAINDIHCDVEQTTTRGQGETLTRDALNAGYQTIAVVGGDGTISETVRGFFQKPNEHSAIPPLPVNPTSALAILPGGTGNDFARGLTGGRAPLDSWIQRLVYHCKRSTHDTTRVVDTIYAEVTGTPKHFLCLNAATIGVSADVAARVSRQGRVKRRLPGEVRFGIEGVHALRAWRNHAVQLIADGHSAVCQTSLIVVANGIFVGGGMKVAPGARIDDGKLDALAVCNLSRLQVLRHFSHIYTGKHVNNERIVMLSGAQVRVETVDGAPPLPIEVDGDVRGHTPATFRIIPGSLRIVW